MEVDGNLEVIRISVAEGALLDGGDLGIQTLGDGVRNAMLEIGQDVGQVALDQLGGRDDGREATVCRPEGPALPEPGCPAGGLVAPELAQRLLDGPGAGGLQFHRLDGIEVLARALRNGLGAVEPQVTGFGCPLVGEFIYPVPRCIALNAHAPLLDDSD